MSGRVLGQHRGGCSDNVEDGARLRDVERDTFAVQGQAQELALPEFELVVDDGDGRKLCGVCVADLVGVDCVNHVLQVAFGVPHGPVRLSAGDGTDLVEVRVVELETLRDAPLEIGFTVVDDQHPLQDAELAGGFAAALGLDRQCHALVADGTREHVGEGLLFHADDARGVFGGDSGGGSGDGRLRHSIVHSLLL